MSPTDQIFSKAAIGLGVTESVGSDRYGMYIAFTDPSTKTIGCYSPRSWMKGGDWTNGHMAHDPFDPSQAPTRFFQAFRGHWHSLDRATGQRIGRASIALGCCDCYRDPSF